jgi:osmotically-inducible protein OsmY
VEAFNTDQEIQRDVLDELKWDMRVQPNEVGVAVKDGIVTLTSWVDVEGSKVILRGTVRSYAEWKAADETARSAPGVTEVENKITISYS